MRHGRIKGKLGVKTKHRKALLRNLVRNLVIRKRIRTTWRKAKVASSFADSMVELAKRGGLHARRTLISRLGCPDTANTLIMQIAPHFKDRKGGYTRVLRLGGNRVGDNAEMALLEFTALIEAPEKPKKPKKDKKAVQEEAPKPKKEKVKAPEKETKEPKSPEGKKPETKDKKEAEKKGGFLGALRRFIKGDEKSY